MNQALQELLIALKAYNLALEDADKEVKKAKELIEKIYGKN